MLMYILCGRHMVHKFHLMMAHALCVLFCLIYLTMYLHVHTFFGVCICYIQIYSYRQTHVIMHARCAAIMYCKCLCVCACLCLRRMDSDMCSFAGRDVSDISMSC